MFERGRVLGNLETETKWQIKDAGRRTREAVRNAAARLQRERDENWSELSGEELLERLIDRQVLYREESSGKIKDSGSREAFGELCRLYFGEVESKSKSKSMLKSNSNQGGQEGQLANSNETVGDEEAANANATSAGNLENNDIRPDEENSIEKQKI